MSRLASGHVRMQCYKMQSRDGAWMVGFLDYQIVKTSRLTFHIASADHR